MKHNPNRVPRVNSLVRYADWYINWANGNGLKFTAQDQFIYLGEIPNMKGHCIAVRQHDGKMMIGYHIENYVELTEDET